MPDFLLERPDHWISLAGSIQEETEFCDVSLACEDQQVRAHKVVLAASSPKLRSILLNNPHPHPLIYLSGVKFPILENILKFIYSGEAVIRPDHVNSFLDVAQELQVKGLGVPKKYEGEYFESDDEDVKPNMKKVKAEVIKSEERQPATKSEEYVEDMEEFQELIRGTENARKDQDTVEEQQSSQENQISQVEEEEEGRPVVENMNVQDLAAENGENEENGNDEDYEDGGGRSLPEAGKREEKVGRKYICPYCQKKVSHPSVLKDHVRIHTKEKPFSCKLCSKKFNLFSNLKRHVNTVHLGKRPHKCPHCPRRFGRSGNLKQHIKRRHPE